MKKNFICPLVFLMCTMFMGCCDNAGNEKEIYRDIVIERTDFLVLGKLLEKVNISSILRPSFSERNPYSSGQKGMRQRMEPARFISGSWTARQNCCWKASRTSLR
mgnify:CR=1 FL=1